MIPVRLPDLHQDQLRALYQSRDPRGKPESLDPNRNAWAANAGNGRQARRCGRRWGKTIAGQHWIADGAINHEPCGWFAPSYKYLDEVWIDLKTLLEPVLVSANHSQRVMRVIGGGRIDFWSLEDERAGRSRYYKRIIIDEAGYSPPHTLRTWQTSIEPTLLDLSGRVIVTSNTNGVDPENFLYAICNDPKYGFIDFHAPSISNPTVPRRRPGESEADHAARRIRAFEDLRERTDPRVFRQEYLAEFVDWAGDAFFSIDKLMLNGQPMAEPLKCDTVVAVMDTAIKDGKEHDGTGVIYVAYNQRLLPRVMILDYEYVQIQGASLVDWLPGVFANLEQWARRCGARAGAGPVYIEDAASGQILLQQGRNKGWRVEAIPAKLTTAGKDARAIMVSQHVYGDLVKLTRHAHDKIVVFKGTSRNHLVSQITGFKIGDPDAPKRSDDLLDCFVYALAITLGVARDYAIG